MDHSDRLAGAPNGFPLTLTQLGLSPFSNGVPLVVAAQPPSSVTAGASFGLVVPAENVDGSIDTSFNARQRVFLEFVLQHYVSVGVEELDQDKLAPLLRLRYHNALADAVADLGAPEEIGRVFSGFQKFLYEPRAAA